MTINPQHTTTNHYLYRKFQKRGLNAHLNNNVEIKANPYTVIKLYTSNLRSFYIIKHKIT